MKKIGPITKYFQITAVMAGFVGLALLRQLLGYNNVSPIVNNQVTDNATPNSLIVSTGTPPAIINRRGEEDNLRRVVSATPVATAKPTVTNQKFKDGTYTGSLADAYYGNVQVQLVVSSGKIAKVNIMQFPNDNGTSRSINNQAMPMLQQEVIQAQSGNVNAVSGASASSQAFSQSLNSAIQQARVI